MSREELDQLLKQPANWTMGAFYHCKEDPRLVVKNPRRTSITVNLSKPMAIPLILFTLAIIIAPIEIEKNMGILTTNTKYITLGISLTVILTTWFALLSKGNKTN